MENARAIAEERTSLPPSARPGLRRKLATMAVMTGLVVTAFEGTVVTSAMPSIARELGGMALYPWVFSAFLIASTLAVPLFGKLADRLGRRPVFTAGMVLFLLGSVLCGTAHSMPALVLWRVVQGLGVGAVGPIGTTVSADLYTLEERARVQGLFTGTWGLANVAGPVIGGWIVLHASWRWVFLVNVPIGALAVLLLLVSYVDPPRTARAPLDVSGAALAGASISTLLLAAERELAVGLVGRVALLLAAAGTGVLFVRRQRRAPDPILPLGLLRDPVIRAGAIGSLFVGALLYVPAAYVPLWISGERGGDALHAGMALVPTLVGWAIGSTVGVKVMVRWGMRTSALGGYLLSGLGATALTVFAARGMPTSFAFAALLAVGLGLGPAANAFLLGAQTRAGWASRGVATSAVHAARTLGGSFAVALLGAVPQGPGAGPMRFAGLAVIAWTAALVTAGLAPAAAAEELARPLSAGARG